MEENGTKTTRTVGAWVKLATAIATAVATVAAAGTALYTALDGVEKSQQAEVKAEAADNKADGAYAALASKIDALAMEVAYLKGKVDGREVVIKQAATMSSNLEVRSKPKRSAMKRSAPPSFKKGAKFKVGPFQNLPGKLDDLVQMQAEYQSEH